MRARLAALLVATAGVPAAGVRAASPVDLSSIGSGEPTAPPAPPPAGPADAPPAPPAAPAALLEVGQEHPAHWAMAARAALQLTVDHDGWYELDGAALVAAGLDPGIDPRRLGLFAEGRPIPLVVRGETDGVLDASDSIAFHGRGQNAPSTDSRIYWLTVMERPGARLGPAPVPAGAGAPVDWFLGVVEWRPRQGYAAAVANGDESNLFGPAIADKPVTQRLRSQHALPGGGPPLLEVGVQGISDGAHVVVVEAGGVRVGTLELTDWERRSVRLPLPALRGEELEITLRAAGGATDLTLVDFVRLTYPRALVADGGRLRLSAAGGTRLAVSGFAAREPVEIVDVTEEWSASLIAAEAADPAGVLHFDVPGTGLRQLLARARTRREPPRAVVVNQPSAWNASQTGGDLLAIGPAHLLAVLEGWRRAREAQGWRVVLVDIADVYDEFSYGARNPGAIRSFIARARRAWSRPPRAVLLIGDATLDPRNQLGRGDFDLVPTKLLDTYPIETASDDWFTDLDGDDIADVPVGRLPVRSASDLTILIGKILSAPVFPSIEQAAATGPLVFVTDKNDEVYDFRAGSIAVRAVVPAPFQTIAIDRGTDLDPLARLRAAMLQGPLLVGYLGHGSQDLWGGGWLSSRSVAQLDGPGAGAFWSELTCLNGFFQDVFNPSLAEVLLLRPTGGAFGVWASSGLTDLEDQLPMGRAFISHLMAGMTVGEAARRAKALSPGRDVRRTWILFGDPTWQLLRVPASVPPPAAGAPAPRPLPPPDAAPIADAGDDPGTPAAGCSCSTRGTPRAGGLAIGVGVAILAARRRSRHSRRAISSTK